MYGILYKPAVKDAGSIPIGYKYVYLYRYSTYNEIKT